MDDVDLAIQFTVFLIMVIVGLDLTRGDFGRLTESPALIVVATVAQWLLLPVVAWAVAWTLPLPPHIVAGIVLLAACQPVPYQTITHSSRERTWRCR